MLSISSHFMRILHVLVSLAAAARSVSLAAAARSTDHRVAVVNNFGHKQLDIKGKNQKPSRPTSLAALPYTRQAQKTLLRLKKTQPCRSPSPATQGLGNRNEGFMIFREKCLPISLGPGVGLMWALRPCEKSRCCQPSTMWVCRTG